MANYYSVSQNVGGMRTCPIDPVHVVKENRFSQHLIKCKKNNPDVQILECPFNARHLYVKADEFLRHKMNCPDSAFAERIRFEFNSAPRALIKKEEDKPKPIMPSSGENWDEEPNGGPAYSHTERPLPKGGYVNGAYLSRMRPAEKRAFHASALGSDEEEEDRPRSPVHNKKSKTSDRQSSPSTSGWAPSNLKMPISSLLNRESESRSSHESPLRQQRLDEEERSVRAARAADAAEERISRERGGGSRTPEPGCED